MGLSDSSFTPGQITFIERLAGDTKLDAGVIAAWLYAEENGGPAQSRESAHNHDWLNIGYTDTATLGASNNVWGNPTTAADASAKWIAGTWSDPGFGRAAPGIQAIMRTAGQGPGSQIAAIQRSGWASSGYPDLPGIYASLDSNFIHRLASGTSTGGTLGLGGTGTTANPTSAFQVGDTSNPDEDYFTAINRLAQGAQWYSFSDGETLYVADGTELINQKPVRVVDVMAGDVLTADLTLDNTAFQYVAHHKIKGRIQRKATLAKVTSPVEMTLELICDIDEIRAGDVVWVTNSGPGDGRWLVGDARRSVFSISSELTLVPALAPIKEAGQVGTATSATGVSALNGTLRQKVVQVAQQALTRERTRGGFVYQQTRPYPSSLTIPGTIATDCSGFAILCYKGAGAPDPNGTNYDGSGFTGSLESRGTSTHSPQPGDLVFWGGPDHVGVYIGGGNCIEFGSNPGPAQLSVSAESGFHSSFLGYRSYL